MNTFLARSVVGGIVVVVVVVVVGGMEEEGEDLDSDYMNVDDGEDVDVEEVPVVHMVGAYY